MILKYQKQIKKTLEIISFYFIPLLIIGILIMNFLNNQSSNPIIIKFGDYAYKLLILILFISPINSIFNFLFSKYKNKFNQLFKEISNILILNRKQFGIAAFYFALAHSIGMIYYVKLYTISSWKSFDIIGTTIMITGIIAFIGMLILGLTSNNYSLKKFKKNWKKIQYLVYPTFILVIFHKYLLKFDLGPIIVLSIYTILKLIQYKIEKK